MRREHLSSDKAFSIAFSAYRLVPSMFYIIQNVARIRIIIVVGVWASIWLLIIRKLNDASFYQILGTAKNFRVIIWLLICLVYMKNLGKRIGISPAKVKVMCIY